MNPEVEAAIIAGGVGLLTVIVALYGTWKTSQDTKDGLNKQLTEQREALNTTLKAQDDGLNKQLTEQREALNTTMKAQDEQLRQTLAEQRTRTLNERFATAADKLGSDKPPAIRLAGVYAMAGLADDWEENRQTCVDILCAYLRLPYEPDPGDNASAEKRLAFRADREVRHTVIGIIRDHLRPGAAKSWQGLDLNFTGVAFDGGDFSNAVFSGGKVSFQGAVFSGGEVSFRDAVFSGGEVSFTGAEFAGEKAAVKNNVFDFSGAKFVHGKITFREARFSGGTVFFGKPDHGGVFSGCDVSFRDAEFIGSDVAFFDAQFTGSDVSFRDAKFSDGSIQFGAKGLNDTVFSGGKVSFQGAKFSGTTEVSFENADFSGTEVSFILATFSGGEVSFENAKFSGSDIGFYSTTFSGSQVDFRGARFSSGQVDFSGAVNWTHPPTFDWGSPPPPGIKLPRSRHVPGAE